MIIPIIVYIVGLVGLGYIKAVLDEVAQPLFEVSSNTGSEIVLLHAAWSNVSLIYAIVGGIVLVILAQKRGGGGGMF